MVVITGHAVLYSCVPGQAWRPKSSQSNGKVVTGAAWRLSQSQRVLGRGRSDELSCADQRYIVRDGPGPSLVIADHWSAMAAGR